MARDDHSGQHPVFLFADIAGFTALTEAHGDSEGADLAARFCAEASALIPPGAGELVKTIGDAVMARLDEPRQAVELGLALAHDVLSDHGSPVVRVGMHRGAAVEREGDWFGAVVNVAARVAGLASGSEVLVTEAVRAGLEAPAGTRFEDRGSVRLRNVAVPVQIFAAVREGRRGPSPEIDPVCRMVVEPGREAGRLRHAGTEYRFCSLECAGKFAADPLAYIGEEAG